MENIRPTFLTVLCILTFIGSSWGIIGNISNYRSSEVASGILGETFENIQDQLEEEDEVPESISKIFQSVGENMTPEKIKISSIWAGISGILTLIGAILMWGLRKNGFYLYVFGTLISILAPLIIYQGSFVGIAAAGGSIFVGIIFVVLYSLNLKHLN